MTEEELEELQNTEHPKLEQEGLCRVSFIGATGIEWICIREAHNPVYIRKKGDRKHRKGAEVSGTGSHLTRWNSPQHAPADRHLFVNRYPYRTYTFEETE